MIFKKQKNIHFVSLIDQLENDEILSPKPYRNLLPSWWNSIPTKVLDNNSGKQEFTIRRCPGIIDFFSNFFVMPMWLTADVSVDNNQISFSNMNDKYNSLDWDQHPKWQLIDHADIYIGDRIVDHTIKINTPWSIITPKGYSVMILPPIYSFNKNFTPMPGVVDTDIHHEINIPSLVHSNGEPFKVKEGDPFVTIFPFKRTKYNISIVSKQLKYYDKLIESVNKFQDYGLENGAYRKMQKDRDNKKNEKWIESTII